MRGRGHLLDDGPGVGDAPLARLAWAVLSTEDVDRDGDILRASGCVMDHFRANPALLASHDNANWPIGTVRGVRGESRRVTGQLVFHLADERSRHAARLVAAGVLRGVSIGFQPLEMSRLAEGHGKAASGREKSPLRGYEIRRWSLLEVSLVSVPANPGALIYDWE